MKEKIFTSYQVFIIAILTFLQFTIILDFMVLSPLGAVLMPSLKITPSQFGMVVSGYAFSAGLSGLLAAGFADKFDRKKLLLFFYIGFIGGTALCGIATTYEFLLFARIVTGLFGGVLGSISYAIVTDLFKVEVRGRVMGFLQMAFASSQVLGIPFGLYLANRSDWHAPFLLIVAISILVGALIVMYMKPVDAHLAFKNDKNPFQHVVNTVTRTSYIKAFAATVLLATGGFMLMPFASAFSVNNLGLKFDQLPLIYFVTGMCAMVTGPFIGKASDSIGKYTVFCMGSVLSMIIVVIYCNMGVTPLWLVILLNVAMFTGVSTRLISSSALISVVPDPADRGAFMSVNSSIQQISGGIATFIAGLIVVQEPSGMIRHYDTLGYVSAVSMVITVGLMYIIHEAVLRKVKTSVAASTL
jgi:predicted MFS family arabinose efflux permease